MPTVAELEAKKASIAAEKDKAVAKAKKDAAKVNEQLRKIRAAAKLEAALEGLTDEERTEALAEVT